jgi:preprotein translocase subunit SecG
MSAFHIILLIALVAVCLLMLLLILMQRPRQEGLGAAFGVDVTSQMFGSRTTDVLQRGTVYLTVMFFLICVGISVIHAHQTKRNAAMGKALAALPAPAAETQPAKPAETNSAPVQVVPQPATSENKETAPPAQAPPATGTPVLSQPPAAPDNKPAESPAPKPADGSAVTPSPVSPPPAGPSDAPKPSGTPATSPTPSPEPPKSN